MRVLGFKSQQSIGISALVIFQTALIIVQDNQGCRTAGAFRNRATAV